MLRQQSEQILGWHNQNDVHVQLVYWCICHSVRCLSRNCHLINCIQMYTCDTSGELSFFFLSFLGCLFASCRLVNCHSTNIHSVSCLSVNCQLNWWIVFLQIVIRRVVLLQVHGVQSGRHPPKKRGGEADQGRATEAADPTRSVHELRVWAKAVPPAGRPAIRAGVCGE